MRSLKLRHPHRFVGPWDSLVPHSSVTVWAISSATTSCPSLFKQPSHSLLSHPQPVNCSLRAGPCFFEELQT